MAGQPVTFSFWARKGADYSPTASAMVAALVSGTGTDQYWLSFTGGAAVVDTTVTLTTSWQRFTFTATPASNVSQFYIKFEMNPTGTAQTNDYFEVTGVQLEAGSQVTPFEQRQTQTELSLCQRYYWRHTSRTNDAIFAPGGIFYTSTAFYTGLMFPVAARTTSPTAGASSNTALEVVVNGTVVGTTSISMGDTSSYSAQMVLSTSATTAGQGGCVRASAANDYVYMENEL